MEKYFCCTTCPLECKLTVTVDGKGNFVAVVGNRCPRGEAFALQELVLPLRVLTTTVRLRGSGSAALLPVRSDRAFDLARHKQAVQELGRISCRPPIRMGEVVAENIEGTGVSMLATCDAD